MRTYNLKRFSKPEFLRRIDPKLLLAFLRKFPQCVSAINGHEIDYDSLACVLASPRPGDDPALCEAMMLIDGISDDKNFDLLHRLIENKSYAGKLGDNITAADLALTLWLHEPALLEKAAGKASQRYPRSFIYFRGDPNEHSAVPEPTLLGRLTRAMNLVFQRKKRGRNVKIAVLNDDEEEYRFMIRKGEPYSRDSAIRENGTSGSVYYRPERFDLVVLRPKLAELRLAIYRKAPWLIEAYRKLFGYTFYRNRDFFSRKDVFTLKPLLTDGAQALVCRDVPGIEAVTIVQLKFETERRALYAFHGPEALKMLGNLKPETLSGGELVSAKFKVRLASSTTDRMVTIKDENLAEFKYDADGEIIEQWLKKRGFFTENQSFIHTKHQGNKIIRDKKDQDMVEQTGKISEFWNNVTAVRETDNALCNWRSRMGPELDFDKFTSRFLVPTDKYADTIICAKQCSKYCGHRKIVRHRDGEFEAYCPENPIDGFVIDPKEALQYAVRESTLVEEVVRALDITPYMAKLTNHKGSWSIGHVTVGGKSFSVFFTLLWNTELLELILELNRLTRHPYVLLGTAGNLYRNVVAECMANSNAVFVPLNETLDFNAQTELELIKPFSWDKLLLPPETLAEEPENIFRKCGDAWEVRFQGSEKFMLTGANIGARYIHYLLRKPNAMTPIASIMHEVYGESVDVVLHSENIDEYSLKEIPLTGNDNIADEYALRQYKEEIEKIRHDFEAAKSMGDNITAEQLEHDLNLLYDKVDEVVSATGQKRSFTNQKRKLVDAFRRIVVYTIGKIEKHDKAFAAHLTEAIKYGQHPGYLPDCVCHWDL